MVFVYHLQMELIALRPYLFWSSSFYLFVDMFFMLSGFIMVSVYAPSKEHCMAYKEYRNFIWRRIARIYPLHLLTIFFVLTTYAVLSALRNLNILSVTQPDIFDGGIIKTILTNILLVHSWGFHHDFTLNTVSWSISVEWAMYLIFPLLLLLKRHTSATLILLVSIAIYILIYYRISDHHLDVNIQHGLIRAAAGFLSGMSLFYISSNIRMSTSVAACLLFLSIATNIFFSFYIPHHWLLIFSFWGLIVSSFLLESWIKKDSIPSRIGNWLGEISYSFYLWHLIIIIMSAQIFDAAVSGGLIHSEIKYAAALSIAILLATLLVSHWSFKYFELPSRSFLIELNSRLNRSR